MGYYTSYNMDVHNVKSQAEHDALLDKMDEMDFGGNFCDSLWNEKNKSSSFFCAGETRWPEQEEQMNEISKAFPEMTFKLYGTGDDPDDRWYELYKNGESELIQAVIMWPEPKKIEWRD